MPVTPPQDAQEPQNPAARAGLAESPSAPGDPYAWRLPQDVISLDNFDFPQLHRRSEFDSEKIGGIIAPRMAGCAVRRSPEQIRDMIRSGKLERDDRIFLNELIMQFDCYDIRRFTMYCGISVYEMARAMIGCGIRLRLLTEWMNCHSPRYESTDTHHRTWDLSPRL